MTPINRHKLRLSRLLDALGAARALARAQVRLAMPFARAVNYHAIDDARGFERQLQYFRERFENVNREGLWHLRDGRWPHTKPGIILSFDDAEPSHHEVAAPLLEKYGFTGWFFVPIAFVQNATRRAAGLPPESSTPPALTWDQVRKLDRQHVVGCHSFNHVRLSEKLSPAAVELEIVESKAKLEEELGRPVDSFCWVGGEEWAYSRSCAEAIRRAGYKLSFMTNNSVLRPGFEPLQIQRTNLESHYPMHVLEFQLSGLLDVMYQPKRRRVTRLTG